MALEQLFVVVVVLATVAVIIHGRISVATAFASAAFVFYALGMVSTATLTAQLTNPGVLAVTLLMLVSVVLNKCRLLERAAQRILDGSHRGALARLIPIVGLHSAFLNNTAVVASLIGPIQSAKRMEASRLLLPLAYAASLGGMLTLIGTSTNLLINGFVVAEGLGELHLLTPLPLGLVLFGACGLLMWLLYPRLLRHHTSEEAPPATYFIEARVLPESSLVGRRVSEAGLRNLGDLFLVEILRGERLIAPVTASTLIEAGDRLVFSGDVQRVDLLASFDGLSVHEESSGIPTDNLLEVVISGESFLRNRSIKDVDFRARFDAAVVAVRRSSRQLRQHLGSVPLQAGDVLVLAVGRDFETRNNLQRNFIPLSRPIVQRFVQPWKSALALSGFAVLIALSALGLVEFVRGLLVLLVGYLLTGLVTVAELRRNVPWKLLITIASALVVSQVVARSGVAALAVTSVLEHVPLSPTAAVIVVLLATVLLTELITNAAAAALMFPLAISTADSMELAWLPFVMAVLYGASASFLTPHAYQTNLMVMAPGGYRPRDYLRAGAPLTTLYLLLAAALIPVFFPL